MGITSVAYITFLILVIFLYYCVPSKAKWVYLLACNFVYMLLSGDVLLLLYPICAVFVTWICTNRMEGAEQKKRKQLLLVALFINIGILIILKYLNLGVYTYNAIVSRINSAVTFLPVFRFAAPIGLSFYTMSILSYIFDVYYEIDRPEKNYLKLLLFATYFPLMISGPIVKYRQMREELFKEQKLLYANLAFGVQRICFGFFKVLVISERLSVVTKVVFDDFDTYQGTYILIAAMCFALQLYTNFSGSMDIIIGVSQMLGIVVPENFKQPFFSESIQEFWQRWHITLGTWLKEYVMYPVLRTDTFMQMPGKLKERFGKKKAKQYTTFLAMAISWFIVGLWHGGSWKYIWGTGMLQCLFIIFGELTAPKFKSIFEKAGIDHKNRFLRLLRKIRTFLLISFSFIFFNASSLTDGFKMIGGMFRAFNPQIIWNGALLELGLDIIDWGLLAFGLVVVWGISMISQRESFRLILSKKNVVVRWCILYALIVFIVVFGSYGPGYSAAEFIYQGF